ncbi:FAD:protein FMN transferase [Thiofilum flexile]|uniref:FAD:protein FMN transferase n=1 Tax=Thiofilum flexile TaxID=125627 RepID=UPI00035D5D80|nr:FAD:protein FMN transferase [Thiofilum flexile]
MQWQVLPTESGWAGYFQAMGSPCVILLESDVSYEEANASLLRLAQEVWRIEAKYSRYQTDSVLSQINQQAGQITPIDSETYQLLQVAQGLWQWSEGRFDATSGILRHVWSFKGQTVLPTQTQIDELLPMIGWDKVSLTPNTVAMRAGMQLDLGGIGKEYAADRCAELAREMGLAPCLINLGGDIATSDRRAIGTAWQIGIEDCEQIGQVWQTVPLLQGGMATSGDSFRFIEVEGKRYSHLLDARSGWPISHAPRSVTVAAPSCTEAGLLTTLAMLQGEDAEAFLRKSQRPFWVQW